MENVYKRSGILFKILPCIFLVIFIGMICCSSCFASSTEIAGTTINFPNFYDKYYYYFFIYYVPDAGYYFLSGCFNEPITYGKAPNGYGFYSPGNACCNGFSFCTTNLQVGLENANEQFLSLEENVGSSSGFWTRCQSIDLSKCELIGFCSNFDIKSSEDGSVVFQATLPEKLEGVIAKQIQPKEMNKTLQEIVGILPIVMIVVVSYLALRKALKMLSTSLRNS